MVILQPCPICGSEAGYSYRCTGFLGLGWTDWVVLCKKDHSHVKAEGRTQEAAATEWNSYEMDLQKL